MGMIYGRLNDNPSEENLISATRLKNIINWKGSDNYEINYGKFSGGFFYDPKLPYTIKDFFYIDTQREILILVSGVIYNQKEICTGLNNSNINIDTPELIFKAYITWGEEFVQKLNGDFAIFIYELISDKTYLYRDHIGNRPLSYTISDNAFWFSSDALGLCKALYANEGIDADFIKNQLIKYGLNSTHLLPDYNLLPNKSVLRILPGHYLSVSRLKVTQAKYWFPEKITEQNQHSFESAISEIKSLLIDAVEIRSDSRFTASTHLSGGIDSGIVAGIARKQYTSQRDFYGYCWTPQTFYEDNLEYDERVLVNKLGEFTNIIPHLLDINYKDYMEYHSDWRNISDLFYEIQVRRNAKTNGVNLIFSGWGGDEFISINNIGVDSDLAFKLQWKSFLKKNPIKKPKQLLGAIIYNVLLPAISLRFYSRKKTLSQYSKYLKNKFSNKPKTINDLYFWRSRKEMHLRYLNDYHLTERIEDWNINGYRNGIEYRYPLLDKRIIEFMLKIPSKLLFKNGYNRILMREAGKQIIPDEVRWHVSKNDPVRINELYNLEDEVCKELFKEIDIFKSNPVFDFINFDLLLEDIKTYQKKKSEVKFSEKFEILFFLKKAHEFSKSYYN